MVKNIFLDAGGIILNEDMYENESANIIVNIIKKYNKNYLHEHYWKDSDEAIYRYIPKVYEYILYKNINDENEYLNCVKEYKQKSDFLSKSNFMLQFGLESFLKKYYEEYNIGILGQYGIDFKNFLEKNEIIRYFSFAEIQDDYKITKPDPRYFVEILNKCKCKAEESVMVGDRMDKDIIPAKMVGMKTIRMRTGKHKNQEPRILEEKPDLTVDKLDEIKEEDIKAMGNFT